MRKSYEPSHRGTFAALMKFLQQRVNTDWECVCRTLIETLSESSLHVKDLTAHLHAWGVYSAPWLSLDMKDGGDAVARFSGWDNIPEVVAVTVVLPRSIFNRFFEPSIDNPMASPSFQILIQGERSEQDEWEWESLYSDIHLAFGNMVSSGPEPPAFHPEEDACGWEGSSPVLISVYVPTAALQMEPLTTQIKVVLQKTVQNFRDFHKLLTPTHAVFETTLGDKQHVFVTKPGPDRCNYPVVCPLTSHILQEKNEPGGAAVLSVNVDKPAGKISSITGHLDIRTQHGRTLLESKTAIELRQRSPFVIDIVFGKNRLVCPVHFTVAVSAAGARLRIARKSHYVEVVAPLADPTDGAEILDCVFPTTLDQSHITATLAIPHLNLDTLPAVELSDRPALKAWLPILTSSMFCSREKRIRDEAGSRPRQDSAATAG